MEPNANPNADVDPNAKDPNQQDAHDDGEAADGEIETRISAKQRVLEARGQEVPMDFFLYSCLEYERLLKARGQFDPPPIQWPLLMRDAEGRPADDVNRMNLAGLLTQLCVWYRDEFPHMNDTVALDHEHAFDVVPPLFALNRDIADLYKVKIEEDLPEYEASVGNNKFWDDIEETILGYFSSYGHLFLRYIKWAHGTEPSDDFEPGSRPPVGRYAPRMPRFDGPGGRSSSRGAGPDRSAGRAGGRDMRSGGGGGRGGEHGPRRDGPGAGQGGGGRRMGRPEGGSEQGRAPERGSFERGGGGGGGGRPNERAPRRDAGSSSAPRGGGGSHERDRRPPRGGKDPEASARLETLATADVDNAIGRLAADSSIDEVTLKPQNSFYRRIQHQRIIDAGFHSFSVGEGNERAVKVSRKES